jgi:hypothetical protein
VVLVVLVLLLGESIGVGGDDDCCWSSHDEALSYFRDNVVASLALDYHEMKMADIAINFGVLTKTAVLNAIKTAAGIAGLKGQLALIETQLPPGIVAYINRLVYEGIAPGDVYQNIDPENADMSFIHTRNRQLSAGAAGAASAGAPEPTSSDAVAAGNDNGRHQHHGRKLSGHDEWGGVKYSVQLSHYSNVYTKGRKPSVYEVIASIGGASSSLIGLIGIVVAGFELASRLCGPGEKGGKSAATAEAKEAAEPGPGSQAPVAAADLEVGLV